MIKIFSENLRTLRKEKGLSQKSLAEILGTNNSSVCDWECGRSEPSLETLKSIALYFNVSSDYLIGLEDESGSKEIFEYSDKTHRIRHEIK